MGWSNYCLAVREMIQLPEIRQLRVFIALVETRSFTLAASTLHITQSAVSHSLKSLEMQLDCQLIERLGKKCILTPHGEVFLHHAKLALKQLEGATLKIKTLNTWGYSSLRIGVSHSQSQYVLPFVLAEFYRLEKKCEVFVDTGDTRDLLSKLDKGELDIAFGISRNNIESEYKFHGLVEDTLCFITHPEHSWTKKKPEVTEDYEKERFIIYGNNTVTASNLSSHLSGLGIKYKVSLSVSNMESIKAMVALNLGVGIIAEWVAREEVKQKSLILHPIHPAPARQWGYYISRNKSLTLTEVRFIDIFARELENAVKGT
jgi:LysR family transcriptional regulator, low CO2-responsive transcriptional regulator